MPEPEKPKRKVALYTEKPVLPPLLIKDLQDVHFLPLKMVKADLEPPGIRAIADNTLGQGLSYISSALLQDTTPKPDQSISQLAESSGLSTGQIKALAKVGAVSISESGDIDFRDAAILNTWGQAQARGFDDNHKYTEIFFKHYVDAMKQLANFEVSHFLDSFEGALDRQAAGEMAAEGIEYANKLLTLLHNKFVVEAIQLQNTQAGVQHRD